MAEKFSSNYAAMEGLAHRVSYDHRVSTLSIELNDAAEYTFTDRELQEVLGFVELMNNTSTPNDSAPLPPSNPTPRLRSRPNEAERGPRSESREDARRRNAATWPGQGPRWSLSRPASCPIARTAPDEILTCE